MSIAMLSASDLHGRTVRSRDGETIGKVDDVLVDRSGRPQYIETKSGRLSGGRRHVIPASRLRAMDGEIRAGWTRAELEAAPAVGEGEAVDDERERAPAAGDGGDARAWDDSQDLGGEDLSRGPTPRTRHPESGVDDVADTTEGPTPETRRADRIAEMRSGERPHAGGP